MMAILSVVVFIGAFASAVAVIASSVAPQWRRMARLAMGHVEQPFAPLSTLAHAERRIAVRRWATSPAPVARLRAAA